MPVRTRNIPEATYCCPPFHSEINTGILTRDSAHLLLQLYPLFLWSGKNCCVLGRRILHIISPHVYGKDNIKEGYFTFVLAYEDVAIWDTVRIQNRYIR